MPFLLVFYLPLQYMLFLVLLVNRDFTGRIFLYHPSCFIDPSTVHLVSKGNHNDGNPLLVQDEMQIRQGGVLLNSVRD